MPVTIRRETEADVPSVREVNRRAFGRDAEADLVDALRAEGFARMSLVAEEDGRVVGHVLFSIVTIAESVDALALAPLAVSPEWQGQGIGSRLVREGLEAARGLGSDIVIVLGEPEYYARFGFSAKMAEGLRSPYAGPYFLALELRPGVLKGVTGDVRYATPFERL